MKKSAIIIFFMIISLSCSDAINDMIDDLYQQVPICVDGTNGNDANDGRGWRNAVATIQRAVAIADDDDYIWVSGTFNVTNVIVIQKPISIHGGFDGSESRLNERKSGNKTVITGTADPAIQIRSKKILIDRLTFDSKTLGVSVRVGEVAYSATVHDCVFSNNFPVSIYTNSGTLNIENCTFSGNVNNRAISTDGGEITILGSDFKGNMSATGGDNGGAINCTSGNIKITGCRFENNSANGGYGGAIYCNGGVIEITGTLFKNNTTRYGGAIGCLAGSISLYECVLNGNTADSGSGGAVYCRSDSKVRITGSVFTGNTTFAYGAGIYCLNSKLTVINSMFKTNTAESPGGAISISGEDSLNSPYIIVNTLFSNNQSTAGGFYAGGIFSTSESSLYILNCTFYKNTGTHATNSGSLYILTALPAPVYVYNSVFYQNSGSYSVDGGTGTFYNNAWDMGENSAGSSAVSTISLGSSPFLSTTDGDSDFLRLKSDSLCINSGLNDVYIPDFTMPLTDLAGNLRIIGDIIDIGAYESL